MTSLRILTGLFAAGMLAACASGTYYSPSATPDGYGYSDQKIEDNRYRIVFRGNSLTERETVENYLLYRAAEVTVENGYDHFMVVREDTEKETTVTGYRDPFYYGRGRPFPYYGYGYRWDPFYDDVSYRETQRYTAMAYIVLGKGPKPEGEPTAYNAQEVLDNLGGVITRPES